jgi:outer membrane receptor protein involved in Fe transport
VRGSIETSTAFHLGRLAWESEITDRVSNRAAVSFGFQDLSFTAGDLRFLLDYFPLQFNEQLEIRPVESLRLRPGLDILWATYDISAAVPRPSKEGEFPVVPGAVDILESEIENETQYQPAAYFEAEWDATQALTLVPGVRAEYYDVPGVWGFDGRLSSRYALSEQLTLKGAVGTFHNAPLPDEVIEPFGNPDLGLEWAIHYVLGAEYAFNDYLDLDFQVFFKDMLDLVTRSDAVVERDGEQVPEIYNNEGEGRVYGAEILFRHQLANNFFGWIAYSISRSERRDDTGEDYRLFSWDQTHVLSVLGSYELGGGWTVGARFRFVTGNPETPVEGSVYDADNDVYVRIPGDPRSVRLDPFHQLDVRVDKRFVFDAWLLDIYLDVSNVYNRGNPETIEYNFDYSESQPVSGLPIIPSIGIRGEF